MIKKRNIISAILLSLVLITTSNVNVFADGTGKSLDLVAKDGDSSNSSSGTSNSNGTSNSKPSTSKPKPKPSVPATSWGDKINYNGMKSVSSWARNDGLQYQKTYMNTKDITSEDVLNYKWTVYIVENGKYTLIDTIKTSDKYLNGYKIKKSAYYHIEAVPHSKVTMYYWYRNLLEVWNPQTGEMVSRTGVEPTKTIREGYPKERDQTENLKAWDIYLKEGDIFNGNFNTAIENRTEDFEVDSSVIK